MGVVVRRGFVKLAAGVCRGCCADDEVDVFAEVEVAERGGWIVMTVGVMTMVMMRSV